MSVLARVVPELDDDYRSVCAGIRYHHAVVVVVELDGSALPYYWVTIGDRDLPFTVAVEHTRMVGTDDYSGRTIVYLGRYAAPEDPLVTMPEAEVLEMFLKTAAERLSPAFNSPLAAHLFRGPGAQPIVPAGWAARRPDLHTGIGGLVAANMAQIYPWDRGINYSVALGEQAAAALVDELAEVTAVGRRGTTGRV